MKRNCFLGLALLSVAHSEAKPPKAVPVPPPKPAAEDPAVPRAVPVAPPATSQPEVSPRDSSGAPAVEAKPEVGASSTPAVSVPVVPAPKPVSVASASIEERQFALAEALAAREQWDAALPEYTKFVEQFPASSNAGTAYFRIAEIHLKAGNVNSAQLYYGKQLACPQPGPFAGLAAYRMAAHEYKDGQYELALAHYKKAAEALDEPNVKRSAQYFIARSLQALGRRVDSRNTFQPLADSPEPHPFREESQFQLALLLEESGSPSEALARFQKLAQQAQVESRRAESMVRVAQLLLKTGDPKKALPALEAALTAPGTEEWRLNLRRAVLDCHAKIGNFEKVIEVFSALESELKPDQLPDALDLLATACLELKKYPEALIHFERLIEIAPESPAAAAAKYSRLRCLYNLEKTELPREVDVYVAGNPPAADRDNAQLMKAEFMRVHGDLGGAAEAYARVVKSKELKPQRKSEALLRLSECGVKLGNDPLLIDASTQFLAVAGTHALVPTALGWRSEAFRRSKNLPAAEKDYRQLLEKHPKFEGRSLVMFQLALLRGEQNDNAGMSEWFEKFLKEFPNDPNAVDAHHWTGWAAFEARNYQKALVHLPEARKGNPDKYFESDSLRLIYCAHYLGDVDGAWGFVKDYVPRGKTRVPSDLLRWCAREFRSAKAFEKAEPVLTLLSQAEDVTPPDWLDLGRARLMIGKFDSAKGAFQSYLQGVSLPPERSVGFLEQSRAELGLGDFGAAQKSVEEALRLQPEGRINVEARIAAGDVQAAKKEWELAAKTYASVAVLVDDDELSALALEKAYRAYKEAGKTKEAADTLNRLQSRYPEHARERLK